MFEEAAANGRSVVDVTGKNVAAFCDEFTKDSHTYTDNWRDKLNSAVVKNTKN